MHKRRKLFQYLAVVLFALIGSAAISLCAIEIKSLRNDETVFTEAIDAGYYQNEKGEQATSWLSNIPFHFRTHAVTQSKTTYAAVSAHFRLVSENGAGRSGVTNDIVGPVFSDGLFPESFAFAFQLRGPPRRCG